MAEVQRRLESCTVELEELAQLGLFTSEECSTLVKKQFEFENKINSMNKSIQDFKEYITYVVSLYRIIKIRRNKVKIDDKKHHLEYRVLQRIKNLYEMAAMRFPQNVELYFEFFQFCKEASFQHAGNKMCDMMIKHHKNCEEVWLTAARLNFHEKKDVLNAINLLQDGIAILNTPALYLECIQYEVYSVVINEKLNKTSVDQAEIDKLIGKLEIYIKHAKKYIEKYEFYTDLLKFLKKFKFSTSIQIHLIEYLMEHFADSAESWHYLATRELERSHYDVDNQTIILVPDNKAFVNAIAMYERGLVVICQEKKHNLWNFYIQCVVDFKHNIHFEKVTNYPRLALAAFERAAGEKCLIDQFYFHYLELVSDARKVEILSEAIEALPQSVDLWTLQLRIDQARNDNDKINSTFERACKSLGQEALPIWEIMNEYKKKSSRDKQVVKVDMKQFYVDAIKQGGKVSEHFKLEYLKWMACVNIDECYDVYKSFTPQKCVNKETYEAMLSIQPRRIQRANRNEKAIAELESIHKDACEQIGEVDADVWINYIKFLYDFKPFNVAKESATKTVIQVKRKLHEDRLSQFEKKYDDLLLKVAMKGTKRKHV